MSVVSQIERRFSPASDIHSAMSSSEVMARLAKDKPLFHYLDEEGVQRATKVNAKLKAGDWSIAVTPRVMKWIGDHVNNSMRTIETGAGYTTVLLGAIAREHYCCTYMSREVEKISAYIRELGLPPSKIKFIHGSTDQTLPQLELIEEFDFAYIDGCHGYPFAAMDWHHIDLRLKVGGIIGMDNCELRPVREHCEFLEENGTYELIGEVFEGGVIVRFYRKLAHEQREWVDQAYSRANKDPCDKKLSTRLRRKISQWLKPYLL